MIREQHEDGKEYTESESSEFSLSSLNNDSVNLSLNDGQLAHQKTAPMLQDIQQLAKFDDKELPDSIYVSSSSSSFD